MRNIIEKIIKDNALVKIMFCRNFSTYKASMDDVESWNKHLDGLSYIIVKLPRGRHKGRFIAVLTDANDSQELIDAACMGFATFR